jgi:protein phosphatase
VAVLVAVVVAVVAVVGLTWTWARHQYFVGNEGGYVAIYRGLPGALGPVGLHAVEQVTTLTVDSLPDFEASQVEGTIPVESLASAQQTVQRLSERAAQCTAAPTTPGCPTTTGADSGTATPGISAGTTALPSPSGSS